MLTQQHDQATRGLAAEYTKEGIRFNCLQPVVGETAML